ncbi:DNA cytosine methyltransferase [Sphingomonas phyllosphaerae]|uniref:DNA cytosine methyltransferase n=1 Tax=Sphingomonas phyllosphaerae TaxID=257003 RepID=UPI0003B30B51|nr:DNA (cytosine-5-)-methyltransferase [Sphingomonas phyllosphaerae]
MKWNEFLRAVDLYAGIGGWSLGLRLAGIEVVASYEWWQPAIDTHNGNHGGSVGPVDIRKLSLDDLPCDIDLVVGSPPCTEFSYANRGGSGDLAEGMKDLVKFFEVVAHLKPRFWAMENVPRVADVLEAGFANRKHPLYRFRHLGARIEVVDFSEFGAPQARRRCIATNIPFEAIRALESKLKPKTLGDVISALAAEETIVDPVWGVSLPAAKLTEMETEVPLGPEELRMNRDAKVYHSVYNNMAFPDLLDAPSRTVTATCTRVSRESIVLADPKVAGSFRRLTVRERGCLQGFPITYQFYGRSFAEKAKMIGNAIPPTFTYLLSLAAKGVTLEEFEGLDAVGLTLSLPEKLAPITPPDQEGRTYPLSRGFRAALPNLRFKSGMRFDLSNDTSRPSAAWRVRFFFGSSKDIREVDLDGSTIEDLHGNVLIGGALRCAAADMQSMERDLRATTPQALQSIWARKSEGRGPFALVDELGELAATVHTLIEEAIGDDEKVAIEVENYILAIAAAASVDKPLVSASKLRKYSSWVLAGMIVGDWFNTLDWHQLDKQLFKSRARSPQEALQVFPVPA